MYRTRGAIARAHTWTQRCLWKLPYPPPRPVELQARPVLVVGMGRSGTTWLASIINNHPDIRYVWEPFNPRMVPQASPLDPFRYLRVGECAVPYERHLWDIVAGRLENRWTRRYQAREWGNRVLIKSIRLNLKLAWVDELLQPRIVLLVRHPCAVALSRAKRGWLQTPEPLLKQKRLMQDLAT